MTKGNNVKTIRQIADEIGVSKQAVYKKIKKEPLSTSLQGLTTKSDNGLQVSLQGETLIKSAFNEVTLSTIDSQPQSTVDRSVDCDIVELLKENLAILQKQLTEKDNQISDLTTALVAAQQTAATAQALHAGTIKQQLIATADTDTLTDDSEPPVEPVEESTEITELKRQLAEKDELIAHHSKEVLNRKQKRGLFRLFSR